MNTVEVHLPQSIQAYLAVLAEREGVTVEQFVASAVAEKASALLTEEHLSARAARGDRARYDLVLAAVPDVEAEERDRL